jgi:hypothetical protein
LIVLVLALAAFGTATQAAPEGAERAFRLSYKPDGFLLPVRIDLKGAEFVFKKERPFDGREILRGALPISPDGQNRVGFAWDETEGLFYLDLNQNLDLTDDPLGVFRTDPELPVFGNARMRFVRHGVPIGYVADVNPYRSPEGEEDCIFRVRSGWLGEIELRDQRLLLGVVDNMDGVIDGNDILILRTDKDSVQELDDPFDPDRFPAMKGLYVNGRSYDISYAFESGETDTALVVTFAEHAIPMGQLEIEGDFLKRLVLERGESGSMSVAVLESPARRVACPVGVYDRLKVYLETGGAFQTLFATREEPIRVGEQRAAQLKVGAPLNNTVDVTREGNTLGLTYHLLGVGGEDYARELRRTEIQTFRPEFIVYHGSRELYRGMFSFQ